MPSKQLTIPVQFQTVSISDSTIAIGVKFVRGIVPDDKAIEMFCGAKLDCTIAFNPATQEDQQQMPLSDDGDIEVNAFAESSGINVKPQLLTIRLAFDFSDVEPEILARFPKCIGTIKCKRVGAIEDAGGGEGGE